MQAEARVLASMQLGEISIDEGAKQIGRLEANLKKPEFTSATREQILSGSVSGLEVILHTNRQFILSQPAEIQTKLKTTALSGRSESDLDNILTRKSGTYNKGGEIMAWALCDRNVSGNELLESLEGLGAKAYLRASRNNSVPDFKPGGIIALDCENSAAEQYGSFSNIGEVTLRLNPQNFNSAVQCVIGYNLLNELHQSISKLRSEMILNELNANQANISEADRQTKASDLESRYFLAERLVAQTILKYLINFYS